jgi:hypothetical protein
MGFLDSLSTVLDRVGGAAQGFFLSGGNPAGAVQGLAAVEERKRQEKILERNMAYVDPFSSGYGTTNNLAPIAQQSSPGFFAPGGAFRTGVRDFGGFLREFSPIAGVFGLGNRFQNIPPAGAQTINFTPPAETSTSGEIAGANLGAAGALVQAARGLARSPAAKAAVRKTKQTLRRMKGVVDMYNSVCKPAPRRTTTRKTPQKAVQLIKN